MNDYSANISNKKNICFACASFLFPYLSHFFSILNMTMIHYIVIFHMCRFFPFIVYLLKKKIRLMNLATNAKLPVFTMKNFSYRRCRIRFALEGEGMLVRIQQGETFFLITI